MFDVCWPACLLLLLCRDVFRLSVVCRLHVLCSDPAGLSSVQQVRSWCWCDVGNPEHGFQVVLVVLIVSDDLLKSNLPDHLVSRSRHR